MTHIVNVTAAGRTAADSTVRVDDDDVGEGGGGLPTWLLGLRFRSLHDEYMRSEKWYRSRRRALTASMLTSFSPLY